MSFISGLGKLFLRIFKTRNQRYLDRCRPIVEKIKSWDDEYRRLNDEDIPRKTEEFRKRIADGESLDDLLPEAYGLVKNAARRLVGTKFTCVNHEDVWEMVHFDVQLIGGIVLHEGKIAEMATGEGKTLVATLPAYLNSLTGRPVYIVTVNDYLARRDCEWMTPLYEKLGIRAGYIQSGMSSEERHGPYSCDVVYGTNSEFGFDYLRDNMKSRVEDQVQHDLYYAIVDEVDSVLIDEARTPLIISGPAEDFSNKYQMVNRLARMMKPGVHFHLDEKKHTTALLEEGITLAEKVLKVGSLYSGKNMDIPHYIDNALKAHYLYKKDRDYIVKDNQVIIIDEFTGRLMPGRRWSDGLHQAIEAKEGIRIQGESQTLATITLQNYFRMFDKLAGMTGTAITEAEEFYEIYGLETIVIPTNKPLRREELPDVIFATEEEKFRAIVQKIREVHATGRPILVGTISIEKSERLSAELSRFGIKHEVLNAKHHQREAEIIAKAGQEGAVTIATNMAGRGTDIKLGPGVAEKGGLFVLGTERHEARRIDNQLRGRTGRQGDPGTSQFYISLEDDLMRIFAGEWVRSVMKRLGFTEGQPIESRLVSRGIEKAQKRVEQRNFDIRKSLLEYDEVMNEQRTIVYQQRQELLERKGVEEMVGEMIEFYVEELVSRFPEEDEDLEREDIEVFRDTVKRNLHVPLTEEDVRGMYKDGTLVEHVCTRVAEQIDALKDRYGAGKVVDIMADIIRVTIDEKWKDHLLEMDYLKQGIHLRGYAQVDPKIEYKREGYELFNALADAIKTSVAERLLNVSEEMLAHEAAFEEEAGDVFRIESFSHQEISSMEDAARMHSETGGEVQAKVQTIVNVEEEPGPNDPCPCGSGKKYKKCCKMR